MISQDIYVKNQAGAYVTGTVRGMRASCTMSAECAARRLAEKLFGAALVGVVEVDEGNCYTTLWRATVREAVEGGEGARLIGALEGYERPGMRPMVGG